MQESERIVIGEWLLGRNREHIDGFDRMDFSDPKLFDLIRQGKDVLEIAKNGYTIKDLSEDYITATSYGLYEQSVKSLLEQATKTAVERLIANGASPWEIFNLLHKQESIMDGMGETVAETRFTAEESIKTIKARSSDDAYHYGIPILDKLTGGIHPGQLTSIAARPGTGKTALALQFAQNVSRRGGKTLYFPLEMTVGEMYERMYQREGLFKGDELKRGKLTEAHEENIKAFCEYQSKKPLHFYEACNKIEDIEKLIRKEKPYLVVIDQLTQLKSKQRFDRSLERYQYMTERLKRIAIRDKVSIMLLCQLNRSGANTPSLESIKNSGQIEEDSDNVILLSNGEEVDSSKTWVMIDLAKQRGGQTGVMRVLFDAERMQFMEMRNEKL